MNNGILRAVVAGDTSVLGQLDRRYALAKRLKAVTQDLISDYASDDLLSGELALITRAGFLQLQLELIEVGWLARNIDKSTCAPLGMKNLSLHGTLVNSLRKTLSALHEMRAQRLRQPRVPLLEHHAPQQSLAELEARLRAQGWEKRDPDLHDFRTPLDGGDTNGSLN